MRERNPGFPKDLDEETKKEVILKDGKRKT